MTLFTRYKLTLHLENLMAGIPKHPDLIASWLEARAPSEYAFSKRTAPVPLDELAEDVAAAVHAEATEENKIWCGFKSDENGLYVDGYHVKSHLKDCANILQKTVAIKALKAKLADRVFVEEARLPLGYGAPAGYWEHPVHVMTMQGPRSALKRSDYVEHVDLHATLRVLEDRVITEATLRAILDLGAWKGFGAERGLGNGRYAYELATTSNQLAT